MWVFLFSMHAFEHAINAIRFNPSFHQHLFRRYMTYPHLIAAGVMCVVRCSQGGCPSTFLAYLIIFLIWEAAPWTNIVLFVLSRAKVVFFVWILDLPKIWAGYILLAGVETRPPGKANGSLFSGRLFGLATPLAGIEPSPSRKTRRPCFLGGLGWAIILHRCMFLCSVR